MEKSLRGHYRRLGEGATGEMSLQAFPNNCTSCRRRDVLRWRSVPQPPGIKRRPEKLGRRWLKDGCNDDEAERRSWRTSTSDDWWNSSARYDGAARSSSSNEKVSNEVRMLPSRQTSRDGVTYPIEIERFAGDNGTTAVMTGHEFTACDLQPVRPQLGHERKVGL